jgi:bacteriorhodopsin
MEQQKKPEPDPTPKYSFMLRDTFITSYLVLYGYTIITFIEAIRTPSAAVRNIMNIETAISFVAAYVYGMFLERMKFPDFDLKDITHLRYLDWTITTPLIILGVLLFYNKGRAPIDYKIFLGLAASNWAMLGSGYLGETQTIGKTPALLLGFLFLAIIFITMYTCCIPKGSSYAVFSIFAVLWSLYGVAYTLEEENKNIMYNVLDVCAKALFGVVLWAYFGRILDFK